MSIYARTLKQCTHAQKQTHKHDLKHVAVAQWVAFTFMPNHRHHRAVRGIVFTDHIINRMYAHRHAGTRLSRRHEHTHADTQSETDRQTDSQTDRQTDRQTETEIHTTV